jgi:DNA-binding HxlR family transcriptional regulator
MPTFRQDGTSLIPGNTQVTAAHIPLRQNGDCHSVARVLSRIGDKWSVLVIMMLAEKPLRFNELRRTIGGISQRMLTLTLRGLERDGLVTRHLTPIIPPRVDYQLTALGRSLREPVIALGAWAKQHGKEIERAQSLFDRGSSEAPTSDATPCTAVARP